MELPLGYILVKTRSQMSTVDILCAVMGVYTGNMGTGGDFGQIHSERYVWGGLQEERMLT